LELRDRLLRMLLAVLVIFVVLFPFANEIYTWVASPLMAHLPEGTSMIATEVASPFLTPFKLSLVAAIFLAMPFILFQFWAFVAPGLYQHEKRLAMPLLVSSVVLFYVGMLFAYFVVFPLVFGFLTGTAPEGVAVMTDIARYLDFVLTLFFAFGLAFEVPIATILLVATGVTTPASLASKRPYIIVGAFAIGMLLTPPDVISQTLLALPMWVLFELGVIFSRMVLRQRRESAEEPAEAPESALQPAAAGGGPVRVDEPAADLNTADDLEQAVDNGRFRPMTDEEMEAELDAIEAEEVEQETAEPQPPVIDPVDEMLQRVQRLRDQEDLAEARQLLYQVLEQGDADQRRVARNILAQLD
jgi:sec-independent protein translocase protein TatC